MQHIRAVQKRLLTSFFCSSSFFLTSASFLCFRAALHRGSFGLLSSAGTGAVFATGTSGFAWVVLTSAAEGSTLEGGSTLVAANFPFVVLFLCGSASFVATASCVVVFALFVSSFIVLSSPSGTTRPKLHYRDINVINVATMNFVLNLPPLNFSLVGVLF